MPICIVDTIQGLCIMLGIEVDDAKAEELFGDKDAVIEYHNSLETELTEAIPDGWDLPDTIDERKPTRPSVARRVEITGEDPKELQNSNKGQMVNEEKFHHKDMPKELEVEQTVQTPKTPPTSSIQKEKRVLAYKHSSKMMKLGE